ncbi:type III pantothenate kinase [Desulfovibrio sp. OttesenSCG-928-A18]|nr:type III pantothenate kinase [Desulfovibrio sp. OttesenSCG-928-A18]
MSDCVLYFDIGNTNTKIGVGRTQEGIDTYVVPSKERQTADQFGLSLLEILRHAGVSPADITGALASSVVPNMSQIVKQACARFAGQQLLFAPEDVPIPLENRYARPHEVGADRLVGAYAARRIFPEAGSIISVDFGTATTFDCVEGNAYLGGLICPGVLSSVNALAAGTAKLPGISLEVEDEAPAPGRSTSTSLNHGFVFGFAAMAEGLCARLARSMRGPVLVVGTGGFARALSKVTDCFDAVRPDLLLEGLGMLHELRLRA